MMVGLNCGCPTRMRKVFNLLVECGYSNRLCELNPPNEEKTAAIRIDTDSQEILGKNSSYPDHSGDTYGCDVCIDLFKVVR